MNSEKPISVIVPVLNDGEELRGLGTNLKDQAFIGEVIVSDGGSTDSSEDVARNLGFDWVTGSRGRGTQMNRGAERATGEILWFLHADTRPEETATKNIIETLQNPHTVGGAFRFRLSEKRWFGPLLETSIHLRSSVLGVPYGDQGYFIRRSIFKRVGGFPDFPIMEDVEILRRLKREGHFAMLGTPIEISPRRWDREGFLSRTLLNWSLMVRYRCGVSPDTLAKSYRPSEDQPRERACAADS